MNTRLLMSVAALYLGGAGLAASFLPQELLAVAGGTADPPSVLAVKIAGALCIGFAAMNWAARGILIGGIYSRPVALGNFAHFAIAAIVLLKSWTSLPVAAAAALFAPVALLAIGFGIVLFMSPVGSSDGAPDRD